MYGANISRGFVWQFPPFAVSLGTKSVKDMEMTNRNGGLKRLPVGIQTFEKIIDGDYLYIDKTKYMWDMIHLSKYVFLSRPRRFGKSLLVSTLQSYFEGRKELFKGLAIEKLEQEWVEYPVLRISMASGKHMEKEQLERYLINILEENERRFGLSSDHPDPNVRLKNLIANVHWTDGQYRAWALEMKDKHPQYDWKILFMELAKENVSDDLKEKWHIVKEFTA